MAMPGWLDHWPGERADVITEWPEAWLAQHAVIPRHDVEHAPARLGRQTEALYFPWFCAISQQHQALKNIVISEGTRTVGELDFCLHHDQPWHVELAVKWYCLMSDDMLDWHAWHGPNGKDSLGKKAQSFRPTSTTAGRTPCRQVGDCIFLGPLP